MSMNYLIFKTIVDISGYINKIIEALNMTLSFFHFMMLYLIILIFLLLYLEHKKNTKNVKN
jgi:hypothetical protein